MNHPRRLAFLLILCTLLLPLALWAQPGAKVQVRLHRPPPNQLKIADLWRIDLNNTTGAPLTVYLRGTVDEAADGRVLEATSAKFRIPAGTMTLTGSQVQPVDVDSSEPRYRGIFLQTGTVPSGSYTVCVTVFDAETDEQLGTDCYVQVIQQLSPPILVNPPDESEVEQALPAFSWLPPAPLQRGQKIAYNLRIVEVLGRQTPYDAMQSNPAWYEQRNIPTTVHQYPISARSFQVGHRYAWKVVVYDAQTLTLGTRVPLAESEIWSFTVVKPQDADPDLDPNRDPRIGGTVTPRRIPITTDPHPDPDIVPRRNLDDNAILYNKTLPTDLSSIVKPSIVVDKVLPKLKVNVIKELLESCWGQ